MSSWLHRILQTGAPNRFLASRLARRNRLALQVLFLSCLAQQSGRYELYLSTLSAWQKYIALMQTMDTISPECHEEYHQETNGICSMLRHFDTSTKRRSQSL